jgi:hypothetical protein
MRNLEQAIQSFPLQSQFLVVKSGAKQDEVGVNSLVP